jgi:hypothetical protein
MSETIQNITAEEVQVVDRSDTTVTEETVKNNPTEDPREECEKVANKEEENEDENDEEELDIDFPSLSLKAGTELYVVTVDGVPQCYTNTIQEARSRMWDFARVRRFQETQYNSYIRERKNPNDIEVVGYHRFSIINVDRTICWLSVRRIQQVEEKTGVTVEDEEEKEPTKSTGLMASFFG